MRALPSRAAAESAVTECSLSEADLPDLQRLAQACLDADGGLPMFGEPPMLRARILRMRTLGLRAADGRLVGAAGLALGEEENATSGVVDPSARRRGLGTRLLRWSLDASTDRALQLQTETCAADADLLYRRHGLARVFAETVMCHDLAWVPHVAAPAGVLFSPIADATETDLFAAYRTSFADRPGFSAPAQDEWLTDLRDDEEWRRDLSGVAYDAQGRPVGFVNVLGSWVDQVGVVPAWRGRGLGAFLVANALRRLAAERATRAWLCVNVDNPAAELYERLGFRRYGTRARYVRAS